MAHKSDRNNDTVLDRKPELKNQKPKMYTCVFLNDDYTEMGMVTNIIQKVFHKSLDEAESIMLEVHLKGKATVGEYTFEVAETKCYEAMDMARNGPEPAPLQVGVEPLG